MAGELLTKADEDAPETDPAPTRTRFRPELRAMNQISGIMDDLDPRARERAMVWLWDLYCPRDAVDMGDEIPQPPIAVARR